MPVETRSRAKRLKRNDSSSVEFNPHWDHGVSQGLLLDIGPDLLTLVTRHLDVEDFCALRMTHPAIYLQSLRPSTWSPKVGKKMWLKEMIRKMVVRPLRETSAETSIGAALNGLSRIELFIEEGKLLASQMVVKRNLSPCLGEEVGELMAEATAAIEINSTWRCEELDWHPVMVWRLKTQDGRRLNIVCCKYYAVLEAFQNLHVCLCKREMRIKIYVNEVRFLDWEIDMNEPPFRVINGPSEELLAAGMNKFFGILGVGPIALAGMAWLLLREGGLACCSCEPCLARFKEMKALFENVSLRGDLAKDTTSCSGSSRCGDEVLVTSRLDAMRQICSRLGVWTDVHEIERMVLRWVCQGEEIFGEFRGPNPKGWDISGLRRTIKNVKNLGATMCCIGPFTVRLR